MNHELTMQLTTPFLLSTIMDHFLNSAGKKLFERHLQQYAPADPMYESYTDAKGKERRRRRAIPPGLSSRDAKILKSVQRRAHYLDKGFSLCGLRFGWTFIIGIIPGAGDVADAALNYLLVVRKARQVDIPSWLLRRMLVNNAVSAAVGLIPVAGDVVLAAFKANSRNAALLEEFLRIRGEEFMKLGVAGSAAAADKSKPVKGKGKMAAHGVSKADAEQVKPGVGIEDNTILGGTTEMQDQQVPARTPGSGKSGKSIGRKGFGSFFGKTGKAPSPGEKGRFVENVDGGKPQS
ncbi:hypothetical protein J3R30DRAFT_3477487 [Lentinula aciculospora]|uniref:Ph domain-containing protein n=1 Tax=Lentinula aciculospora TaxID=153920 RepID=A0A9W9DNM5_9AGAR|nr:hypothetical protein J3R30DRAFT_3477487 [Lentinula aciculospora]